MLVLPTSSGETVTGDFKSYFILYQQEAPPLRWGDELRSSFFANYSTTDKQCDKMYSVE